MILRDAPFTSESHIYMERYVDRGSPSGFTEKHTTCPGTRPTDPNESFYLCSVDFPEGFEVHDYGSVPEFFQKYQMLVHPCMIGDSFFALCNGANLQALEVSPTSSGRTVKAVGEEGWFLKLHYAGLIGRLDRKIGIPVAVSATEVSNAISSAIEQKEAPRNFYFMRETFARVVAHAQEESTANQWGIVLREPKPYPVNPDIALLIPAFSLFSEDRRRPSDPSILAQLFSSQERSIEDFLLEDLILPLYDAYFALMLHRGLALEAQAQNILFAIDRNLRVVGVIGKDADSVDKDLDLMKELSLPDRFEKTSYKFRMRSQADYCVRHSFMFDFKLGEYVTTPLIQAAADISDFDRQELSERIRQHNQTYISQLPRDFFPADGCWYSYADIIPDRTNDKRPWISNPNPRYR